MNFVHELNFKQFSNYLYTIAWLSWFFNSTFNSIFLYGPHLFPLWKRNKRTYICDSSSFLQHIWVSYYCKRKLYVNFYIFVCKIKITKTKISYLCTLQKCTIIPVWLGELCVYMKMVAKMRIFLGTISLCWFYLTQINVGSVFISSV